MMTLTQNKRFIHNREISPAPTWQSEPLIPLSVFWQAPLGFSDASRRLIDAEKNILASYFQTCSFRFPAAMEFWKLATTWKQETLWDSSVTQKILHPYYQQIIGMGPAAVPLILKSLAIEPDFWFEALTAITRQQPIPIEHAGDMQAMTSDWLEWGRRNGYEC